MRAPSPCMRGTAARSLCTSVSACFLPGQVRNPDKRVVLSLLVVEWTLYWGSCGTMV